MVRVRDPSYHDLPVYGPSSYDTGRTCTIRICDGPSLPEPYCTAHVSLNRWNG